MTAEVFDLRAERLNRGFSQRELADQCGAPVATIQNLESGRGARPTHAKKVADFFGVQVTDLMPVGPDHAPDNHGKAAA